MVTLMDWLCGQLRRPPAGGRGVVPTVWALATLLRERALRGMFVAAGGPALLVPLLRVPAGAPANIQVRHVSLPCLVFAVCLPVFAARPTLAVHSAVAWHV
jgi:hypothetical protein